MKSRIFVTLFFMNLGLSLCSCYRMPGEDEFSVIPTTNNPAVTKEKPSALMPGIGY